MGIFNDLAAALFKKGPDMSGPMPGPLGKILASMGIHEIKPATRGTPTNVLAGCRPGVFIVPGPGTPALTKEGKQVIAQMRASMGGKRYQVMDQRAVSSREWKSRINDEKRKAEGRWYSGRKVAAC